MIVAFAATVLPSAAAPAVAQDARDRTDGAAPADACADADLEDDRGIVVGTVRDAASGVVLPGTRVRFVPVPAVRRAGSAREAASRALETIADPAGRFRFCAVPPGRYVAGAELAGADEGSEWAIVRPEETTILELSLDPADTEPATEHGRVLARVVDRRGGRTRSGCGRSRRRVRSHTAD